MDNPIPSPHDTLPGPTPGRTSTPTSPSHPPPVHSNNIHQPYNIQQRIRQQGPAGGRSNTSPSLRQSWLFPTNRASPSTALPEATSVMTLSQRPQNMRSDPSSSTSPNSAAAVSPTAPPNAGMNHKERRNFSGSARSRLTKIDRLSKMMLITNASSPSLNTGTSTGLPRAASPRRARLSLQSQSGTAKEVTSAASAAAAAAAAASPVKIRGSGTSKSSKVGSPTSASFKGSRQAFGASHTSASNNYPRHIVMRAASPHCILDDAMDSDVAADNFSTSLPSAPGFPAGVDPAVNSEPAATPVSNEKTNRHASMPPLPKPGWRLYDVPDVEESSNSQHGHDDRPGFDTSTISSGGGDERSIFHYSASNASSTTHLEHYPYSHHAAHARQDSTTSTYYTMTPNASNLDLSMPMSNHNLSSIDPSTDSSSSATSHGHSNQGLTPTPSIYNMPPPLPKAIKNNKSPLALRRSSTTSSSSSSSPSNTYLNKGSFPKSSLSSTMIHNSKTLTQERQKIILEILRTERSYVDGLVVLQTLFYEPLNAPYTTSGYPYSGANTTTSIYSAANTTLPHNNTNKHPNPNINNGYSGWSGATNPAASSSALSLTVGQYPTSTVGSNSTLAASAAPLLPKKSVSEIFSNFSEILQINTLLLTQLETRICGTTYSTGWESDEDENEGRNGDEDGDDNDEAGASGSRESKASGKPNQVLVTVGSQAGEQEQLLVLDADWCVGDIFIEIAPFLKMYSNYVKTYTSALTHINDCMNRNDRFTEFLKSTARRPECKNLDFQSYLMLPVQRIPRYRMLLEGLLRHTPEEHPDHRKLQTAFKSMEQTANFVNETIRQHEMFGEMVGLQSKITGMNEPLIIPGRVMLKRGNVWKVCRRNVQLRMIILFSDCIVWTSPSLNPLDDTLTFHRKVGLENCTVVGAEDPDPTKNAFQIMSPEKSSQVYVDTPREKEAWMDAIRRATQEYLSAKRTLKISITPMQSISAAATSFGAGLLRRDTGLWSPTSFGYDSRAHTFAGHQQQQLTSAEPEVSSPWSTTFGGGFASAIGSGGSGANGNGGAGPGSPPPRTQPMRVLENYNAPVWVPDQSATRCMICTEEFGTIFRRKHHCRACGKVVCHSCSSRTILIKGAHSEKVGRACDDCIETMFPEDASIPVSPTANSNSAETSPIEYPGQQQQQVQSSNPNQVATDRRTSNQSLDGILVRPEDYNQDSGIASGATGMVRGIVEAGLNRMKSRTGPITSNQDTSSGQNGGSPNNTRGSNRKSDASLGSPNENQNNVKACELCKTEFNLFKFKWRNVCSQCRRVVCSDCLTKKQIDQLFLLGLEAEREANAKAREGGTDQLDNDGQVVDSLALNSPLVSPESPDLTRPGLLQSTSDSVVATGSADAAAAAAASLSTKRSQSFNLDQTTSTTATSGGGGYGGFGTGWRGIKNTDSGHGQAEKLCDPCYLGLSSDQIKVLESGGGWQYYQATLGKHQTQDVIAALAIAHLAVDDGEEGAGEEEDEEDEESPVDAMRFVGSDAIGVEVSPVQAG